MLFNKVTQWVMVNICQISKFFGYFPHNFSNKIKIFANFNHKITFNKLNYLISYYRYVLLYSKSLTRLSRTDAFFLACLFKYLHLLPTLDWVARYCHLFCFIFTSLRILIFYRPTSVSKLEVNEYAKRATEENSSKKCTTQKRKKELKFHHGNTEKTKRLARVSISRVTASVILCEFYEYK